MVWKKIFVLFCRGLQSLDYDDNDMFSLSSPRYQWLLYQTEVGQFDTWSFDNIISSEKKKKKQSPSMWSS